MAAAIIEFDSLADAIRATAQNHDLGPRLGVGFVLVLVRGIQVRRERLEFRGAGIDAFENRSNAVARALQPHGSGRRSPNLRQLFITGSVALRLAQQFFRSGLHGYSRRAPVHGRQFLDLLDEPGIDLGQLADFLRRQAVIHGGQQPVDAIRPGRCQLFAQQRMRRFRRGPPRGARLQRTNSLLQRFFESPADGHDFAN